MRLPARDWYRLRIGALVAAVLGLASAGVIIALGDPGDVPAAVPRDAVAVDVRTAAAGTAIPGGFLGFSIEYSSLLAYSGSDPASPTPRSSGWSGRSARARPR